MIETTLFNLINPLLTGGMHYNLAAQGAVRPYGVLLEVVSPTENTLTDGQPIQHTLYQITIWDTTYLGAKTAGEAISTAIAAAFTAGTLAGIQRSRRGVYEADTALHGFIYEFSFWYH
jgi:hypothetical protein